MNKQSLASLLSSNAYPGRGIIAGLTPDGKKAAAVYFIMGRSENSRNRVFRAEGDDVMIYPYDESKVEDPSLIIYAPVRAVKRALIVTNGDQTDTVRDFLKNGDSFENALRTRGFEPDKPNYTPRISALLHFDKVYWYQLSILKCADGQGTKCNRFTFDLAPVPGLGHFIHTYVGDGNPLPSFEGEPEQVELMDDIDALTDTVWGSLNESNRISLFVRFVDLETGKADTRIVNKHQ
ncbi:MAG: IMP cyclohydrolase [Clostridiales bacterium]|nr:IMP cyclohydrolase [Clostridiales bacterium]